MIADREQTERLQREADIARRGEGEWDENRKRSLEEREAAARAIEDRLKLLGRELAADPALGELSRPVAQVGEVEAEGARAAFEQAGREADPAAREAGIERAGGRLARVSERLDELTNKFAAASREGAEISRLSALANRQEELAGTSQATAGDRAGADRAAAEQQAVERDLNNLVKQTPALKAVVIDGQVKEAERLADRRERSPTGSARNRGGALIFRHGAQSSSDWPIFSGSWKTMPGSWRSRSISRWAKTVAAV